MKTKMQLIGIAGLLAALTLFSGCSETTKTKQEEQEEQEEHTYANWQDPQRQWDNTWTQERRCTNCAYAEMRVVLKSH